MKIMVVDDSKTARLFTRKCVEMLIKDIPLEFTEAGDGEEAFKKLEESGVDLILCDVNMPVMTGFTFIRNIKSDAKLASIPVVFVTSMANEARSGNLISLGASDVVQKPLNPQKLKDVFIKIGVIKLENKEDSWG